MTAFLRLAQSFKQQRLALAAIGVLVASGCPVAAMATLPNDNTFNYLNQKYSVELGDDRGACGYFIDPADVYQYGSDRLLTARITAGANGTACRGVMMLRLLQVDCQTNQIFALQLEGSGRDAKWRTDELTLYPVQSDVKAEGYTQKAAQTVCSLPAQKQSDKPVERPSPQMPQ